MQLLNIQIVLMKMQIEQFTQRNPGVDPRTSIVNLFTSRERDEVTFASNGFQVPLLNAVLGSFLPIRLHMKLASGQFLVSPDPDGVEVESLLTYIHEHFHFFQSVFTGYGHITWDSHRQATSFVCAEWRKFSGQSGSKRRMPLGHLAKQSRFLYQNCAMINEVWRDAVKMAQVRYQLPSNPDASLEDHGLLLLKQPWSANPQVVVGGKPHVLQTIEIIEGHALFVESTWCDQVLSGEHEGAWDDRGFSSTYTIALKWFLEQCGSSRKADFPYICDLALQTSWEPVIPTTEDEWQATSPSWRFVKITQTLVDKPEISFGNPDKWTQMYKANANLLLSSCGFKLLDDIFNERLAAFNSKAQLGELEKLMRKAMIFRTQIPWCGANPAAQPELMEQLMKEFPPPVVEVDGRLASPSTYSKDLYKEIVMELHYQAFVAQLLGDASSKVRNENAVECGYAKFSIHNGCEYQRSDGCIGRFQPANGSPHPATGDGSNGCSFEPLFSGMGIVASDIEIDHAAKPPTFKDLPMIVD